jgi:hypothetical protein
MAYGKKMNLLPESPVYIGDRPAVEMELSVITYDSKSVQMDHLSNVDELERYKNHRLITQKCHG